jgi:hypothetical protein
MGGDPGGFGKPFMQVQVLHVFRLPGREGTNLGHDHPVFFWIISKFFQTLPHTTINSQTHAKDPDGLK